MVTSDLGRVTTVINLLASFFKDCGDVRSRTSYNFIFIALIKNPFNCGDVRSRTSYNKIKGRIAPPIVIVVTSDLGRVTTTCYGRKNRGTVLW